MPAQYPTRTYTPQTGVNGLVTGYAGIPASAQPDYPVYNPATGKLESVLTGKAWTGAGGATGTTAPGGAITGVGGRAPFGAGLAVRPGAGAPAAPAIEPWTVTRTPKNPAITQAIDALLAKQGAQSDTASKMFEAALAANPQDPAQLARDQAAFDTTGIDAELRGINRNYEAGQNDISGDIGRRNRDYELFTSGNTDRLRAENDAAIGNIQAATNAAAARAMGYANAVDVAGGNTNASGAGINQRARRLADLQLAAEGRITDRRYNLIGQEQNLGREIYGNDQSLLGRRSSLEADFAGRQSNTAQYLSDLKMRTAGKVSALAQQYLEEAMRRVQMGQQLTTDDIAKIGQIQALDQQANWYEVNKPFDPNRLPQITSAPLLTPGRNYTPPAEIPLNSPERNYSQPSETAGPGQPRTFTPPAARDRSSQVNIAYKNETGFWPDEQFDQLKWNTIYFREQHRGRAVNQGWVPPPVGRN